MEADWVQVRNCMWVHEAELLKSVLEAAGIEAVIPNKLTLGIQPLYANAMGGVRLMVRRADLKRAAEVLDAAPMYRVAFEDDGD